MNKLNRILVVALLAISVTACSDSYTGPVADRPIAVDDGRSDTPVTKTLFEIVLEKGVPEIPLRQAFDYFDQNKKIIKNKNYMSIIDFSQHSGNKRYYLIDLKTGEVEALHTSHGRKSDPDHDGYADRFSNVVGSNMTSLGFMLTAERYVGNHGNSLRLDGLESINSNARKRAIVIHGASYVAEGLSKMGRSLGCPAVENRYINSLIKKIENGSLVYSYYTTL